MAKKIKFPLEMENGIQVRTIEELRENFAVEKVLEYLLDGKLQIWLEDRYYDKEAVEIKALNAYSETVKADLCKILDVEYGEEEEVDIEELERRKERLAKLKQITDNEEFWKNVDYVAFDQEELADLLDEEYDTIYLCGKKFQVPYSVKNITYIGVNKPEVFINASGEIDLFESNIQLKDVDIKNENIDRTDKYALAEEYFIKHDMEKAVPLIEKLCDRNNTRAFALTYWLYLDQGKNREDCLRYVRCGYEKKDAICSVIFALFSDALSEPEQKSIYMTYKPVLHKMSDAGDVIAKYVLGLLYINQTDERAEYNTAVKYFSEGSEAGFYRAMFSLAKRYDNGQGVDKNLSKAHELYMKAAELGHSSSLYEVARNYLNGWGTDKNIRLGIEYLHKAANEKCCAAENLLGGTLYEGWYGQKINYEEGFVWLNSAAKKGNKDACNRLGLCYLNGKGVQKNVDEAMVCFEKAIELGDMYGAYNLGRIYFDGKDRTRNFDKARKYFLIAVEKGHSDSQGYLDSIEGKPTQVENIIKKIEQMNQTCKLRSSSIYESAEIDYNRKFKFKSECENYVRGQYERLAKKHASLFSVSNDEISAYINRCHKFINDIFEEIIAALSILSVDTQGLIEQAEGYKTSIRQGISNLLQDYYYREYDDAIYKDSKQAFIMENESGNIYRHYTASGGYASNIEKATRDKWDKLAEDSAMIVEQEMQPLILELREICEQVRNR